MPEYKEQPVSELQISNEHKIGTVMYAPILSCGIIGAFGIGLLVLFVVVSPKLWALFIMGLCFLAYAAINFIKIKDKPTIDVYKTFLILRNPENPEYGTKIQNEDIDEWNVITNSNSVRFLLTDGTEKFKDTFVTGKAYGMLMETMPEKEKLEKEKIKNRQRPLKFHNPFKKK